MSMQGFDIELSAQDILALRDADSVAVFFTGLGYDTAARIPQTPANLGLSEPVQKRVKRVELIADQAKLFQVYLFELQSVTVADIKAIGRAFRDKAGNFLFVITADYDDIEFVLLDRLGKAIVPTAISKHDYVLPANSARVCMERLLSRSGSDAGRQTESLRL